MAKRRQDGPGLFADPRQRKRRTELAVDKAIRDAQRAGLIDTNLDAGAATLARELARSVDQASLTGDTWAKTAAAKPLAEVLASLGLTPRARNGGSTDEVLDAIRELGKPTVTES